MPITTYAELKSKIQTWGKRTDSVSLIDDFIDLAEADIWASLRIREMEARATATVSTSSRFLELPDNYLEMRRFKIDHASIGDTELTFRAPTSLIVIDSAGMPCFYTVTTQIEFDRVPDDDYTVEMEYYRKLTALSGSATSNAVLTNYPMIYLSGALRYFYLWAEDETNGLKYEKIFYGLIAETNLKNKRGQYGPAPTIIMGYPIA